MTSEIENQKRLWLRSQQTVVVGRSEHANWTFAVDQQLSQKHFQLACGKDSCTIRDLDSSNGTFLNGKRIASERTLDDTDVVKAGSLIFRVSITGRPTPPAASQTDDAAVNTENGNAKAIAEFWQVHDDEGSHFPSV